LPAVKRTIEIDGSVPTRSIWFDRMPQFARSPMLVRHEPKATRDRIRVTNADPWKEESFRFKRLQQSYADSFREKRAGSRARAKTRQHPCSAQIP
jgi:hypothetical protein